ncbi:MAG: hypothetical protein M1819_001069 [Sarea resinae]|nr:MAG: hypothetical protein M1819_001069 [Sarea resinae]
MTSDSSSDNGLPSSPPRRSSSPPLPPLLIHGGSPHSDYYTESLIDDSLPLTNLPANYRTRNTLIRHLSALSGRVMREDVDVDEETAGTILEKLDEVAGILDGREQVVRGRKDETRKGQHGRESDADDHIHAGGEREEDQQHEIDDHVQGNERRTNSPNCHDDLYDIYNNVANSPSRFPNQHHCLPGANNPSSSSPSPPRTPILSSPPLSHPIFLPSSPPPFSPVSTTSTSSESPSLLTRIVRLVTELQRRNEEFKHIHDITIIQSEAATQRIIELEHTVESLQTEALDTTTDLTYLRLQLKALEIQALPLLISRAKAKTPTKPPPTSNPSSPSHATNNNKTPHASHALRPKTCNVAVEGPRAPEKSRESGQQRRLRAGIERWKLDWYDVDGRIRGRERREDVRVGPARERERRADVEGEEERDLGREMGMQMGIEALELE